ncbi:hypothetical protein KKB55_11160 [Myxococcota bacterium]|nr:hypothetical protein [Myxococcota bacterium]MBU1898296.1 hypothetical protein [Myxococcota bacterium]
MPLQRRASLLILLALGWGCDDARLLEATAPPPEGYPRLARRFEVSALVLSSTCAFEGFALVDEVFSAEARTDGVEVEWRQPADGVLRLSGALCLDEAGAFHLRLRGAYTAREWRGDRVCEVRGAYAPSPCSGYSAARCDEDPGCALIGDRCALVADVCQDPYAMDLLIEGCGALEGAFDLELEARRGCPSDPCKARLHWRAIPEEGGCE